MNQPQKWADDLTIADFDFPKVPAKNRVVEISGEDALCNGERLPPTGSYKYRCAKCNRYYLENKIHNCNK